VSGDHDLHPRWLPWAYIVEPYGIWIVKLRCIRHADILQRAYLCQVSDTGSPEPLVSSPGPRWTIAWHHLASVVCKLFTFRASSPKPLGQLEPNLAGMFLGWSSTKFLFFVPVEYSTWLPGPIICSDWPKFQRSSSLKLMNWLNPNCKGMIIRMSFTKFLFFMWIGNPRWPPVPPQDID
jgi:hypothetical protein